MRKYLNLRSNIALGLIFAFLANTFGPLPVAQAQQFYLPAPGVMVHLSPTFNPPILKGIKVHPDNPFRFDFILDQGDSKEGDLKEESTKLIKYFLASLTIPEKDLWVNLSPYEKNRIVPTSFGQTEMGRDLLAEDYMLKQITASLIYPEGEVGKKFWKRIYEEAYKQFGTTNVPVNTFNKVWIVPEKAVVYENAKAGTAYVVDAKLKVMLEQDYLALEKNSIITSSSTVIPAKAGIQETNALGSQIVREIVIPELTKEVNEDKNFAQLRQVYNSLILATWYKKKIKDSILEQVYADKNKIQGLVIPAKAGIQNKENIEFIYQRYLQAFKKGAYNYIKEEKDPLTQETIPRKYFSGGLDMNVTPSLIYKSNFDGAMASQSMEKVSVDFVAEPMNYMSGPPSTNDSSAIKNLFVNKDLWISSLKTWGVSLPQDGKGLHIVLIGPGSQAKDLKELIEFFPKSKQIDVLDKNDIGETVQSIKEGSSAAKKITINFIQHPIESKFAQIKGADLIIALGVFDANFFRGPGQFQTIGRNLQDMLKPNGVIIATYHDYLYRNDWIPREFFDVHHLKINHQDMFTLAIKKFQNSAMIAKVLKKPENIIFPIHAVQLNGDQEYNDFFPYKNKPMFLQHFVYDLAVYEHIKERARGNVLYFGSGVDITHVLLTTNGSVFDMVDQYVPSYDQFIHFDWDLNNHDGYIDGKRGQGYVDWHWIKKYFIVGLIGELKSIGISKDKVRVFPITKGFRIVFEKKFPGEAKAQEVTFNFIKADVSKFTPDKTYDILFEKAGYNANLFGSNALSLKGIKNVDPYLKNGAFIVMNPVEFSSYNGIDKSVDDKFDLSKRSDLHYESISFSKDDQTKEDKLSKVYTWDQKMGYGYRLKIFRKVGDSAMVQDSTQPKGYPKDSSKFDQDLVMETKDNAMGALKEQYTPVIEEAYDVYEQLLKQNEAVLSPSSKENVVKNTYLLSTFKSNLISCVSLAVVAGAAFTIGTTMDKHILTPIPLLKDVLLALIIRAFSESFIVPQIFQGGTFQKEIDQIILLMFKTDKIVMFKANKNSRLIFDIIHEMAHYLRMPYHELYAESYGYLISKKLGCEFIPDHPELIFMRDAFKLDQNIIGPTIAKTIFKIFPGSLADQEVMLRHFFIVVYKNNYQESEKITDILKRIQLDLEEEYYNIPDYKEASWTRNYGLGVAQLALLHYKNVDDALEYVYQLGKLENSKLADHFMNAFIKKKESGSKLGDNAKSGHDHAMGSLNVTIKRVTDFVRPFLKNGPHREVENVKQKPVFLLLGMPASGKERVGSLLSKELGMPALSLGDLWKSLKAKKKRRVSDAELIDYIKSKIGKDRQFGNGFMLDCSFRKPATYQNLAAMLEKTGFGISKIIYVEIKEDTAHQRYLSRSRSGDVFNFYHRVDREFVPFVMPIIKGLKDTDKLIVLNNDGNIDDLQSAVKNIVPEMKRSMMDFAMRHNPQKFHREGGIDFTATKTPLEIQNSGEGIKFHLDRAMLQQLQNAPGFVPVIINIQPMIDLRQFLGIQGNAPTTPASA